MKPVLALLLAIALHAQAAMIPEAKPESVGLSPERLARIHETMQRHMDAHDIAGAVTLVARKGKVAHFEAHGGLAKNAVFRIWSMSKPVAGVAILMLLEEGKLRLNDPVSRFIPEFKGMKVAVAQDKPTNYYTIPAARDHHPGPAHPRLWPGQRPHQRLRNGQAAQAAHRHAHRICAAYGLHAARLPAWLALDL